MKITESQLRDIIAESINEFLGLSLDNRLKNGHWREEIHTKNPVINTAWKYGWELSKPDKDVVEGEYSAKIMSGQWNGVEPDKSIEGVSHPKASWPMLIAMLNKELRPIGYTAAGSNYREARLDLLDRETEDGYGAKSYLGTITVRKA